MSFMSNLAIPALLTAMALALPLPASAAGSNDNDPPKPTETTTTCKEGLIWDEKEKKCVKIQDSRLDDDALYKAARELAYAGRYGDTLTVLAKMSEGDTDRVLTYKGFATRKSGDVEAGMAFYAAAIEKNPDNLLVRSYMGQALVEQGNVELAEVQLAEIVARGGAGTWPETSLRTAIETGETYSH